jgi:hypothetical protein
MSLCNGIWLAVLGVLAASNLIIARRPDAKAAIAKIAPYQGWIGAISAIWGVWGIVSAVLNLGWLTHFPIFWITWLADSVLLASLGLLLGIGVLKTFVRNAQANDKLDTVIRRLAPSQGTLGFVAIGVGVWMVISGFLWTVG